MPSVRCFVWDFLLNTCPVSIKNPLWMKTFVAALISATVYAALAGGFFCYASLNTSGSFNPFSFVLLWSLATSWYHLIYYIDYRRAMMEREGELTRSRISIYIIPVPLLALILGAAFFLAKLLAGPLIPYVLLAELRELCSHLLLANLLTYVIEYAMVGYPAIILIKYALYRRKLKTRFGIE